LILVARARSRTHHPNRERRTPTPCAHYHSRMKKLLLLGLLAAIAAGIIYKVLTTEIPIDES